MKESLKQAHHLLNLAKTELRLGVSNIGEAQEKLIQAETNLIKAIFESIPTLQSIDILPPSDTEPFMVHKINDQVMPGQDEWSLFFSDYVYASYEKSDELKSWLVGADLVDNDFYCTLSGFKSLSRSYLASHPPRFTRSEFQ